MNTKGFKRKLTAIFSADVVGYSRLMGEDEESTVKTLEDYKTAVFTLIKYHRGRVVDSPGDNVLADFGSVVDAVQCGVAVQKELLARNSEIPENRRMQFRIGINLGDVIEEQERIYGDGVNIAARLEGLADPGGICVSKTAFDHIESKLPFGYRYIGEQTVKNIAKPVGVFKIIMDPRVINGFEKDDAKFYSPTKPKTRPADKPSIAVLPFINMSNDPKQEYFSDGMSEELIGALAKLEGLKVISRTSAFHFKGKDIDLHTIGKKLKVDNVLEGSVRRARNRLRISAQLIRVADDTHLWAESYDRELEDVFNIQDEISKAVVQNLKVKLLGTKAERLVKDYTKNTEAYELFLKGKYTFENKGPFGFEKATEYMEKAIKADPDYVPAYVSLAAFHDMGTLSLSLAPWDTRPKISALLQRAIELDDQYAEAYSVLGMLDVHSCNWESTQKNFKQALQLNPGLPYVHIGYSAYFLAANRMNEAIGEAKRAVELDPLSGFCRFYLARILSYEKKFDQAIELLQEFLELDPNDPWVLGSLGEVYAVKGINDKGISMLEKVRIIPAFECILGYCYGRGGKREDAQKILDGFLERAKEGYFSPFMIAMVYAGLGNNDKTFEYLDKAYEVSDPFQFYLKVHPFFSELHTDLRWSEQMQKRGLAN